MRRIEAGDLCENEGCSHAATGFWIGDGGTLAMTRSYMQAKWCECCMLKVQVDHAEEAAKRLDGLRSQLVTACKEASDA